jgi:hypothetical protein
VEEIALGLPGEAGPSSRREPSAIQFMTRFISSAACADASGWGIDAASAGFAGDDSAGLVERCEAALPSTTDGSIFWLGTATGATDARRWYSLSDPLGKGVAAGANEMSSGCATDSVQDSGFPTGETV